MKFLTGLRLAKYDFKFDAAFVMSKSCKSKVASVGYRIAIKSGTGVF